MANAGRPKATNIKTFTIEAKDFARLDLDYEPGIKNTLFVNENNRVYLGDTLSAGLPYDDALDDFRLPLTLTSRNTGSYIFELDSNKSVSIIKSGTTIYLYQVNSGSPMTLISTHSTLSDNEEVYLEAIFGATEKSAITGYTKYAFLSLPGEAWVVAYNTRIGNWQVVKVNTTYSIATGSTVYAKGDRRVPFSPTGYFYEVTVSGISAGVGPVWPTTIGDTVVDGSVTWVCRGRYINYTSTPYPTTTSSSVKTLNGYIFVCVGGDIYNSDLDIPDSWNTTDFISTEIYPDSVVALAKYKNYLVAFGQNTIEFFYDAANASGSPLARQEGILHNIGCAGQGLVTDSEDTIYWVSQTSSNNFSIWTLDKFEAKKVSTPEIDVVLSKKFLEVSNFFPEYLDYHYLYVTRVNGSLMLCVPLFSFGIPPDTSLTINSLLVVDFEKEAFYEWELTSFGKLYAGKPCTYKSYYLFGGTNGVDFLFCVVNIPRYISSIGGVFEDIFVQTPSFETNPIDFSSNNYKAFHEINLNVHPSVSAFGKLYVSLDRAAFTEVQIVVTSHRVTRLGRAREFRLKFQDTVIHSKIDCRYSEHSN